LIEKAADLKPCSFWQLHFRRVAMSCSCISIHPSRILLPARPWRATPARPQAAVHVLRLSHGSHLCKVGVWVGLYRCISEGCLRERLYMGRMATGSQVLLRPGHRWANTGAEMTEGPSAITTVPLLPSSWGRRSREHGSSEKRQL
jgi:hypothetical protein